MNTTDVFFTFFQQEDNQRALLLKQLPELLVQIEQVKQTGEDPIIVAITGAFDVFNSNAPERALALMQYSVEQSNTHHVAKLTTEMLGYLVNAYSYDIELVAPFVIFCTNNGFDVGIASMFAIATMEFLPPMEIFIL